MATNTTNYDFIMPTPGGDLNAWGSMLNSNWAKLDTMLGGSALYPFSPNFTDFSINNVTVTASAAELNILDGVTATTAELNILDGATITTSELNILDGVTANASELNILDGATITTNELNRLDGLTASTAELNILTGVVVTANDLNQTDNVITAAQWAGGNAALPRSFIRPEDFRTAVLALNAPAYVSPATAYTNGALVTLAHGLATVPSRVEARLRCVTTEDGFAVDDEIVLTSTVERDHNTGCVVGCNSTNVFFRTSGSGVAAVPKSSGNWSELTAANWRLIIRAWL